MRTAIIAAVLALTALACSGQAAPEPGTQPPVQEAGQARTPATAPAAEIPEQAPRPTLQNRNVDQMISVRGRNANAQGDVPDHEIIPGDPESSDLLHNRLETPNAPMKGIVLEIAAPQQTDLLIANLPATIEPAVTYTGDETLSFALTQAPDGMSIGFSYGIISWTPQESDEGQTFYITVRATDGAIFAETSFQVKVVQPAPLNTQVQNNVLTIADPTTTLNGASVTALPPAPGAPPAALPTLGKAPPESVPDTPLWITPITDAFVVNSSYDNPVELRFPIGQLPDGVSPGNVNLYGYVEATDVEGQLWSPVAIERSYEGTEASPVYVVRLEGLQGMAFFGYHINTPSIPREDNHSGTAISPGSATPTTGGTTCRPAC